MRLRGSPSYVANFATADALFTRPPHTSTDEIWFIIPAGTAPLLKHLYQSAGFRISRVNELDPLSMKEAGLIEDEQCQRIGGGHKAAKFRFLLFL